MNLPDITFLDVETVSKGDIVMGDSVFELYNKKFKSELIKEYSHTYEEIDVQRHFMEKAGIYAEFGKVIAVSIGKFIGDDKKFYIRTLTGHDERILLAQVAESLARAAVYNGKPQTQILCAHNGFEFDFPYLMRRFMINGIQVPASLDLFGKKPWEIPHLDTMKIWGGTAWNYRVSLELLCHVFGIESSKKEMDGSMVGKLYHDACKPVDGQLPWENIDKALKQIGNYCAGDVLSLARVLCKMKGWPVIESETVEYV